MIAPLLSKQPLAVAVPEFVTLVSPTLLLFSSCIIEAVLEVEEEKIVLY
jgi:hypothetical protein